MCSGKAIEKLKQFEFSKSGSSLTQNLTPKIMSDTLKLAITSVTLFLMLWLCYEGKPQEETLWLMGGALVVFLISVISIGLELRRPKS